MLSMADPAGLAEQSHVLRPGVPMYSTWGYPQATQEYINHPIQGSGTPDRSRHSTAFHPKPEMSCKEGVQMLMKRFALHLIAKSR